MLKVDYPKNKKSFQSEIKIFFVASQVLSFRHVKQTSKNVADTTFNMLVTSLCQTVIHKLKVLGGRNLNIINHCGNHKKGEPNFEISVGKQKGEDLIFDSNLVREKSWRKLCINAWLVVRGS